MINMDPEEIRVAVLEDGVLMDLYLERPVEQQLVGSIYKGRVENVLPGMQAAFVNVGLERNGFLYVEDIPGGRVHGQEFEAEGEEQEEQDIQSVNISDILKRGQNALVQIVKEPFATKGPRITGNITLPGRCLVLMPTIDYIGVSRKIENEEERERLKEIAERIKPENMGLIIRTVAEGMQEEELRRDIDFLTRLWNGILIKAEDAAAPCLLHHDLDLVERTLRDLFTEDVDQLIVDDEETYRRVVEMVDNTAPELRSRVRMFVTDSRENDKDMLNHFGVAVDPQNLLARKVNLKSGGYLVFDSCEAFTAIDVNTGRYVGRTDDLEDTVLQTNIEAACEIARQMRLRNLGGIIVIDFIDMRCDEHQQLLLERFEEELKRDKIRTNILGMTRLGLIEITRKKEHSPLAEVLQMKCPYCGGTGRIISEESVCMQIRRRLRDFCQYNQTKEILVEANPEIASHLMGQGNMLLQQIEKESGRKIFVRSQEARHLNDFTVSAARE